MKKRERDRERGEDGVSAHEILIHLSAPVIVLVFIKPPMCDRMQGCDVTLVLCAVCSLDPQEERTTKQKKPRLLFLMKQ